MTETEALQELTLATITEGRLDERFSELLADAYGNLKEGARFQQNPVGTLTQKIVLEVVITHKIGLDGDSDITVITAGAELKPPKRRLTSQSAYTRSGVFLVEAHEAEQQELPTPRQIGKNGKKGTE